MTQAQPPLDPLDPANRWQWPLPTMYDLPSEHPEDPGLPDEFHRIQAELLGLTCKPSTYPEDQVLVASDLNLYYDPRHPQWYKRPDWFLAVGVPRMNRQQQLRFSYVIWQEQIPPFLVLEMLSPNTQDEDLGQRLREAHRQPGKWVVYEQIVRVPFYGVYERYENDFRMFQLQGIRYQELALPDNQIWFDPLQLGLGIWAGSYEGVEGEWLRWYGPGGEWIPTPMERADRAESALDQERQRAQRLAESLRALGIDPESI